MGPEGCGLKEPSTTRRPMPFALMRSAWGRDPVDIGVGGTIPFVSAFADSYPDAHILLTGQRTPLQERTGPTRASIWAISVAPCWPRRRRCGSHGTASAGGLGSSSESELPPALVDGDGDGDGKVQAAAFRRHRYPHLLRNPLVGEDRLRGGPLILAEHKSVAGPVGHIGVGGWGVPGEGDDSIGCLLAEKVPP